MTTTVLIDFQDTNPQQGNWNPANGPTTTGEKVADLVDSLGNATGLSLYVDTVFTASSRWGSYPGSTLYGIPSEVFAEVWYTGATPAVISIRGFSPGQTGTIKLTGINSNSARDTIYSVSGGDSDTYDSNGSLTSPNEGKTLDFTADGSGHLVVTVTRVSVFGYLTAAEIVFTESGGATITGSGTLTSGTASISGVGERVVTSSGTLAAGNASISGVAERAMTWSGALICGSPSVSGTAEREINGSGALSAGAPDVGGTGERTITGSGSLVAGAATADGSGNLSGEITGTGELESGSADVSGSGSIGRTGSGELQAGEASVFGSDQEIILTGPGTILLIETQKFIAELYEMSVGDLTLTESQASITLSEEIA